MNYGPAMGINRGQDGSIREMTDARDLRWWRESYMEEIEVMLGN
jgi:hypothetical protein